MKPRSSLWIRALALVALQQRRKPLRTSQPHWHVGVRRIIFSSTMHLSRIFISTLAACISAKGAYAWCSAGHEGPCHLKITAGPDPLLSRGVDFRGLHGETSEARLGWSEGHFHIYIGGDGPDNELLRVASNGTALLARQTTVGASGKVSIRARSVPGVTFVHEGCPVNRDSVAE